VSESQPQPVIIQTPSVIIQTVPPETAQTPPATTTPPAVVQTPPATVQAPPAAAQTPPTTITPPTAVQTPPTRQPPATISADLQALINDSESKINLLDKEVTSLETRLDYLGTYPIPDQLPKLISDFAQLKQEVTELDNDLVLVKNSFNQVGANDANPQAVNEVIAKYNTLDNRFGVLKSEVSTVEALGFEELGVSISALKTEINNLELELNGLSAYAVPDEIIPLVKEFASIKEAINTLDGDFQLGRNVRDNLGDFAKVTAGAKLVSEFDAVDSQFSTLKGQVGFVEATGFDELGYAVNDLKAEIERLGKELDVLKGTTAAPEEVISEYVDLRDGVNNLETAFIVGREVRDNLGSLAKIDTGIRLVGDFNALSTKFEELKVNVTKAELAEINSLNAELAELKQDVILLEDQLYALQAYAETADFTTVLSNFSNLKNSIADLEEFFNVATQASTQLGPLAQVPPTPQLLSELSDLKTRYANLKKEVVATELAGYEMLASILDDLDSAVTGLELNVSTFLDSDFASLEELNATTNFAGVERDTADIGEIYTNIHSVLNGLGEFATTDAGDALITRFTAMRVEFAGVKELVDGLETEIAQLNNVSRGILTLETALLKLENKFDSLGYYIVPDEFSTLVDNFSQLKKDTAALEIPFTDTRSRLSSLRKLRVGSTFAALDKEYEAFKGSVIDAESYGFSEISQAVAELEAIVIGLEVAFDDLSEYVVPDDFSALIADFGELKAAVTDLEEAFVIGNSIQSGMGEFTQIPPGPELIAEYAALKVEYNALKDTIAVSEKAGGTVLANAITDLENRFIALGDYFIPDDFTKLVSDFAALKAELGWYDEAFKGINKALGNGGLEKAAPGVEAEYVSLKSAVKEAESIGFGELAKAIAELEQTVINLESNLYSLDSYKVPEEIATIIAQFSALKSTVIDLEEVFNYADTMKTGLNPLAKVDPTPELISEFDALKAEYAVLKSDIDTAEAYGFAQANLIIDDLEAAIKSVETTLIPVVVELKIDAVRRSDLEVPVATIEENFNVVDGAISELKTGEFSGKDATKKLVDRLNLLKVEFVALKAKIAELN
jgi:predicted nuclease with TOPRIM domain